MFACIIHVNVGVPGDIIVHLPALELRLQAGGELIIKRKVRMRHVLAMVRVLRSPVSCAWGLGGRACSCVRVAFSSLSDERGGEGRGGVHTSARRVTLHVLSWKYVAMVCVL